jgi:predicted phage tail protein
VTGTSATLTNLEAGRSYDFRVKAVSPVGDGQYSPVQTQKAGNVPSSVGRPTVTQTAVSGRPALAVSWSKPESDATITRYEVDYRSSSSGSWSTMRVMGANTLTTKLTTLTAGTSYQVRVRAISSAGSYYH